MSLIDLQNAGPHRGRAVEAVVIGAGFSGIRAAHKLRELGISAIVLEAAGGVGGTWYWNRYPGARVDVTSVEYSFSFSKEVQDEWDWSESMSGQKELERYLNFVVDRLELRAQIELNTRVSAMTYDDTRCVWNVSTETGDQYECNWVICATGSLSAPLKPTLDGLDTFTGDVLYTSTFPMQGYDFRGKRVGVVGTGSSGVQAIPEIAKSAEHLYVFQRSAAYARPSPNRPLTDADRQSARAGYDELRDRQRKSFMGSIYFPLVPAEGEEPITKNILDTPVSEQMVELEQHGWTTPWRWLDIMENMEANDAAKELYAELIRRVVIEPEVAEALVPHYPLGCKRLIIHDGYYETFNRSNVTLVNLRKESISQVAGHVVRTDQRSFDIDVLVLATGFDAMTGALKRIEIRGENGLTLSDKWDADGPVGYLGLQVEGFPNLFTVTGPGSPSVRSNMVVSIEQHIDLIGDCLLYMRQHGYRAVQPEPGAGAEWAQHVASLADGTVWTADSCNSWYLGANVPGKKRVFMPYLAGVGSYRERCEEIVRSDYAGFAFS